MPSAEGEKVERQEKSERSDRSEKTDRSDKASKADRVEKSDRAERSDKAEKGEKAERTEKADKLEKADRNEKLDKIEKSEKTDKSERTSKTKSGTTVASTSAPLASKGSGSVSGSGAASKQSGGGGGAGNGGSGSSSAKQVVNSSASAASSTKLSGTTTAGSGLAKVPAVVVGGLNDEAMTQVAQAKFEAQEERLRDVARHAASLLRDYPKLQAAECNKRIFEIRKALMKYELGYLRVSELQEKRRRSEIASLHGESVRCREEAAREAARIEDLRDVLEKERKKRKRYEGYEMLAAEVNTKKNRDASQADIDRTAGEIAQLRQERKDLDARIEERNRRAQLLRHAAAELAADLRHESEASGAESALAVAHGARAAETSVAAKEEAVSGAMVGQVLIAPTALASVEVIS